MCPTSSSEVTDLFLRHEPVGGAAQVEVAFTGTGIDLSERPDEPGAVEQALAEVTRHVRVPVARMHQVHGAAVHRVVRGPDGTLDVDVPEADALVTTERGVALLARAADCVPVLLADVDAGVLAAVHAGRVGFVAGVVPAAVAAMRDLGARQLRAWVGPAVCGYCYEVPAEMRDEVAERHPAVAATTSWGTPSLDLVAGVVAQLDEAGAATEVLDVCTYTDTSTWSYRRQGAEAGRMGALVWSAS